VGCCPLSDSSAFDRRTVVGNTRLGGDFLQSSYIKRVEILSYVETILKGFEKPVYNYAGDKIFDPIEVPKCVAEKAKELAIQVVERKILLRRKPASIASACVYLAGRLCGCSMIFCRRIEGACSAVGIDITSKTIYNVAKEIKKHLNLQLR